MRALIPLRSKKSIRSFRTKKQKEADKVAGLIGMYTGVMLLHDLAIEAFAPVPGKMEEDELNAKPRLGPKDPEELV